MQEPKRKQHATELARARQLLRTRLGWLRGFPLPRQNGAPLRWQTAEGDAAAIVVDRELLRRTVRALSTLTRGEGARFLPELVDDPAAFEERARTVLEVLGRAVHESGPLPADLAGSDFERSGALPFLRALSWCTGGDAASARAAQRWVRAHAELVEAALALDDGAHAMLALLTAFQAAQRGLDVRPVLRLLANEHAHALDLRDPLDHVNALHRVLGGVEEGHPERRLPLPEEGEALLLMPALRVWLRKLSDRSLTVARRELTLLEQLGLAEHLHERAQQLGRVARTRERLARWVAAEQPIPAAAVEPIRAELYLVSKSSPPILPADDVFERISQAAALPPASLQLLSRTLAALPATWDHAPLRTSMLAYVLRCRDAIGALAAERWLGVLSEHVELADGVEPWRWLAPLSHSVRQALHRPRIWHWFENGTSELVGASGRGDDLALAWASWTHESTDAPSADELLILFRLVMLADSTEAGLAYFRAVPEAARNDDELDIPSLFALAEGDPDTLGSLAKLLHEAKRSEVNLALLTELFGRAGQLGLLRRALEAMPRRVLGIASQLERLPRAVQKRLPAPLAAGGEQKTPEWAARYPRALADNLALMERCEPEARSVAERILHDVFPDRDRLKQQIAALRERIRGADAAERPRLTARRDALARRLREKPQVSPRKLENLGRKLRDRAEHGVLDQWMTALQNALRSHSLRRLELDEVALPSSLENDALLVALAELPDDARTLARALLSRRAGPPPWDLRERPENQAFLARLAASGIVVAPWLDADIELSGRDPEGRRLTLRFARDPLEVLRMGEHFNTCLSPGSVNFFSAVTNAVDVNKRVLYAYDENGGVCGRCLFALTQGGTIVTFEPYNHNLGDSFVPLVADVARLLAARMKTALVPSGEVPTLVAARWYDDGARDLAGSFEALKPGSALRLALPTLPLDKVVERFAEACAPLPLGPITLPIILALEELDQRPELAGPLFPLLEATPQLPGATRLCAAQLLARARRPELALRLCQPDDLENLARWPDDHGDLLENLVQVAPSQVLRALKATRFRGVRSWLDEAESRRWVATLALLRLRRTTQAVRLFESVDRDSHDPARDDRRARFAELYGELG